jgi:hypothetical protein
MAPGSLRGLQLAADDVEAARDELSARAREVSDVQDFPWGRFVFFGPRRQRMGRPADARRRRSTRRARGLYRNAGISSACVIDARTPAPDEQQKPVGPTAPLLLCAMSRAAVG